MEKGVELFGKYFLIDRIAAGGMAEIFRAKSIGAEGFEKVLVIKRILPHLSMNEDFVRMFTDEAKIAVQLTHSNIVHVYDFGRFRNHYYIAMEYVEGKDLRTVMRRCSSQGLSFSPEYALLIIHDCLKGLEYAHNRTDSHSLPLRVVHRDVSPGNILVSYEGEIKLADFGIAKARSASFQTKDGVLKGKFEYMSPEQAEGEEVDRRTDIFSSGIILWETLTGRRLFKEDSETKTLDKIKKTVVEMPSKFVPNLPSEMDDIVMKALAQNPANRYQTAEEMRREIVEFLYPSSMEMIRSSLSTFLKKIFEEEVKMEREALERSRTIIEKMIEEGVLESLEYQDEPSIRGVRAGDEEGSKPAAKVSKRRERREGRLYRAVFLVLFTLFVLVLSILGLLVYSLFQIEREKALARVSESEGVALRTGGGGSLHVRITPPDSSLFIDGRRVEGSGEFTLSDLEPDLPHEFVIKREGYNPVTSRVTLKPGETKSMEFLLSEMEEEKGPPSGEEFTGSPPSRHPPVKGTGRTATAPTPAPVQRGAILFRTSPDNARLLLNGEFMGNTPFSFENGVEGKIYTMTLSRPGYKEITEEVPFPVRRRIDIFRKLDPLEEGRLIIFCEPYWAKVIIDGKDTGKTTPPAYNESIDAGTHRVTLFNPNLNIKRVFTVKVEPGGTERLNVNLLTE